MPDRLAQLNESTGPSWRAAPVALAHLADEQLVDWNPACRALLREIVGGTELAWRRWLTAAVARLRAAGRTQEVLAAASDHAICVELRLSPAGAGNRGELVALREVNTAVVGDDDLGATVSTLSHELRTPLASMKTSLKLVLDGDTGPLGQEQKRFLGMTMRNISRLERLVSDLLDISQAEAGQLELRRRETDLGPLLREAVALLETGARAAGLTIDQAGLPGRYVARVDADKIVQMVNNVLGNAIKYVPEGGLVRIWLERRPQPGPGLAWELARQCHLSLNTFKLVVEDNGPGIEAEQVERMFEPFQRGPARADDRTGGAGLGLYITRRLVQAHGGRIHLASQPGAGTTVWIQLPRDLESEQLMKAAAQLEASGVDADGRLDPTRVSVLDLRARIEDSASDLRAVREFMTEDHGDLIGAAVEVAPGVVAAVVRDGAGWERAWKDWLTAGARGARLPAGTVWRRLEPTTHRDTAPMSTTVKVRT